MPAVWRSKRISRLSRSFSYIGSLRPTWFLMRLKQPPKYSLIRETGYDWCPAAAGTAAEWRPTAGADYRSTLASSVGVGYFNVSSRSDCLKSLLSFSSVWYPTCPEISSFSVNLQKQLQQTQ